MLRCAMYHPVRARQEYLGRYGNGTSILDDPLGSVMRPRSIRTEIARAISGSVL